MSKAQIKSYYKKYLGREPDAAGLEYWLGNLTSGRESLASIKSNIKLSKEASSYKAEQEKKAKEAEAKAQAKAQAEAEAEAAAKAAAEAQAAAAAAKAAEKAEAKRKAKKAAAKAEAAKAKAEAEAKAEAKAQAEAKEAAEKAEAKLKAQAAVKAVAEKAEAPLTGAEPRPNTSTPAPAVKPWQQNYDANTSNFEDLNDIKAAESSDPRKVAFENNITGMLEQKGLLADQAQPYIDSAYDQDTTLDALKHIAQQTGTAEDRGDVWGSSDERSGRSFLEAQEGVTPATGDWKTNAGLIERLYTEGFGREADVEGLEYWTNQLTEGTMSYGDIAKSFGVSEEAGIRDAYHQEYGRDADDAGLQYWLAHEDGAATALATMQASDTLETELRQSYADELGQFSNEVDRQANIAAGGMWTDVQEGGYKNLDWRGYTEGTVTGKTDAERIASAQANVTGIQTDFGELKYDFDKGDDLKFAATDTYSAGDQKTGLAKFQDEILKGETTLEDVKNTLERRGDVMTVGATYDVDDTEGGSGIGRTLTLDEIQPHMSESQDLNELASNLGEEKWDLLTKELYKQPDPELGWGEVTYPKGKGAAGVIANPGVMSGVDERGTNRNTLSHNYQVPVPPDYQGPDKANVNRQNVDYMPDLDGTVPDRPLRNLDSSYTPAPQQAVRKQGAFVAGTSAKGVRRRQSSAARSGRSAMGTKQLARNNMQIKSLNI